jgi:diguanylate cyclase (GGDEF)-like protein
LEQLDYITHHDPLTHLPNRARFVSQLAAAMAQQPAQPMGVAYLDLDGFSRINDTYGRELGSELILEVGRRLQGALADGQHLGHIGGDEFAVILPLDGESFEPQLRHLLDAVARPLTLHGHTLQVSASLGFSRWPQHDKVDAEQLLRQADQAMYRAKLAGKNRHHLFDPVTDEHTRERYSRIDDIRLALAQREFVLFYQPKVNLCNGELLGLEALIRWQHPSLGLLTPAHFIPALDGHPLAITLGDWVIEAALAQLAAWKAQGFETRVSVNIDRLQLQDPLFATRLQAQVAAQPSLSAGYLELEILETGALENMGQVSALIRQLQGLGFECALDDFGTGYSSLTFLKQLGANTIKIDQSFVRGLLDDAEHAAIVHSVVGLASNFERVALAEGVETIEHGQALIEFGCEQGQGYAIARPMPAAALADWRARWQLPPPWRDASAIAPRDLPLLLAEVEHRGWMRQLQDWLNNPDTQATPPNRTHCRFGHWLQRPATLRRFDRHPDFLDLQAAHDAMHERVQVLAQARAQGTAQTLAQEWADLSNLAQRLSSHLRGLRTAEADSQWPPA